MAAAATNGHGENGNVMAKTASALRTAFELSDKEKRGVVSVETVKVVFKLLPLCSGDLAPVIGRFAQIDPAGEQVVEYGPLVDWLFGPAVTPSVSASDRPVKSVSRHVFAVLPGLGETDFPGFPAEACPENPPELESYCSMGSQVLRENTAIYARLRERRTKLGVTFARCIKVGMDNPTAKIAGVVAGDADSYVVFKDLFEPVIQMCNDGKALSADQPLDLSLKVVQASPIDPSGSCVLAVRVDGSRNLEQFRFPTACDLAERQKVESILTGAFEHFGEDLCGRYYPLPHSTTCSSTPDGMSQEEEAQLRKSGFLFDEPASDVQLSSGLGRHWPEARGVYVASSQRLVAWVNEEDHLHLTALQDGGDLWAAFARFVDAVSLLEGELKRNSHSFARSSRFGFLTSNPARVGAGLRATVVLRLPKLSSQPGFSQKLDNLGLVARRGILRRDGVVEVTHRAQMGASEANLVSTLAAGCARLVCMEKALEVEEGESSGARKGCATVFSILPGLGDSATPGFPADVCPAEPPSLEGNRTVMAQVLRQDTAAYELLKARRTGRGVTLATCVKPGMDTPSSRSVGAVAGDEESYDVFKELFDPIISQCHGSSASKTAPHPTDLSIENVSSTPIDPTGSHVLGVHVAGSRNVRGFRFSPSCDRAERCAVEQLLANALLSLDDADLRGDYYPLLCSTSFAQKPSGMTADEAAMLERQGILFYQPRSPSLLSAGVGRHWPEARGVFLAASQGLFAWCNEEEHLHLNSMRRDGDLRKSFDRFAKAMSALERHLQVTGHSFARHSRLGYLSVHPESLGAGFYASVVLKLPLLSCTPEFQEACNRMGLWARLVNATGSRDAGVHEVTNRDQFGISEAQLTNMVLEGCRKLVEMEVKLEGNGSKDVPAAEKPSPDHVYAVLPGLGESDYPGFPALVCPTEMPDLSKHQSPGADILRKNPSIYGALKGRTTKLGVTFARCLKPCVDNPSARTVSVVAGDQESYDHFKEFFDLLLKQCHGEDAAARAVHPHQLSPSAVSSLQIDRRYAVGVSVQARRNLSAVRFTPACDLQELKEVERIASQAFASLEYEELVGDYYPLANSTALAAKQNGMTRESMLELERNGFFFSAPESPVKLSSGMGRHWPQGRGVFVAKSRKFVAWCNEEDHLNVSSFQSGGDLWAAFDLWSKGMTSLEGSIGKHGHSFARSDRLGYLSVNPIYLGTALNVSVVMRLPLLRNAGKLRDSCQQFGLRVCLGHGDVCEILNSRRFGLSEADVVNLMITGCTRLAEMESALEGGVAQLPRSPDLKPIEYIDISSLKSSTLGTVVHLKGFAKGIDFCHKATASMAKKAVELIGSLQPGTLAWDGDSYQESSFTYLIPRIWDAAKPRLLMFLRNSAEEQERVNTSWAPLGLPITCCLCQESVPYDELGAVGLQATQSKSVVSFGGGAVLKDEFLKAPDDVRFFLLPAVREIGDPKRFEKCSLEGHVADNLQIINCAAPESNGGGIRETLHELFVRCDVSKRKVMPLKKLDALLSQAAPQLTNREVQLVLKSLPHDVNGNISFDAFLSWLYDSLSQPAHAS